MSASHKFSAPSGLRDFSLGRNPHIFLAVVYDTVRIYSTQLNSPIHCIKLQSTPRSAKISSCSKYFYIHHATNIIQLYLTKTATVIQIIESVPMSVKTIKFTRNSQKIIYGSTQMLCLWNVRKNEIDMRTEHWKNINCYDVNEDGSQFVVGNYNGSIFVLEFVEVGKCNQVQIKRHKTCVATLCCHKDKIISASHDGYFLISTISNDSNGEKVIAYQQLKMKNIPRQIESIGDRYYMYNHSGMSWFDQFHSLTGFIDYKVYRAMIDDDGKVTFVSLNTGQMEWWPGEAFKSSKEVENDRLQRERIERDKQLGKLYSGKQNRIIYRFVQKK